MVEYFTKKYLMGLIKELSSVFNKVHLWLFSEPLEKNNVVKIDLIDEIRIAHQEWINSKRYFESVTDPDLIDHAIYVEEAARKKYEYLLKKAKNAGITDLR